ncbi:PREDICTED: uncharacterized protein LOC108366673 [Rhagoletis zephyria]|uniref:uncharacterized protein LOC108366673 n=1 Tax=Rhagoletis zephyria TaxID=28612 RepID=UPI0008112AF6|nr:PREDICTED: uncharacterized protein LOC108366673 [Rhagoletis zephyria]XP_036320826.1 uncharacterized protein LOC118735276 [Rhagoletis pomonella]
MGCINSTKKLNDLKGENVFRAVRLHSDLTEQGRTGFLELTPRELIFRTVSNQRLVWALQHLRRYGLNGDVFSFEAGRRCMTGPGIYTFRCQRADQLYHLFQSNINAVSLVADEAFPFGEREREYPSHILGRPENIHPTNNYLEPAPVVSSGAGLSVLHGSRAIRDSFSSSPLSLDSPDSAPSLSFATTEVVHFQSSRYPAGRGMYVNTPNSSNVLANSNVYSEHPLRTQVEHNNNLSNAPSCVLNTLNRKNFVKHSSLDIPPEEFAPMLTPPSETLHMYANIDSSALAANSFCFSGIGDIRNIGRNHDRCYENLNRDDLNFIISQQSLSSSITVRDVNATDVSKDQQFIPMLPTESRAVNYIVLDLDHPRSPTQSSPKLHKGSGPSLTTVEDIEGTKGACSKITFFPDTLHANVTSATNATTSTTSSTNTTKTAKSNEGAEQMEKKEESSLGYSTIDFIKTCALIKSSTHGADFDPEPGSEECRITRHSKCVRKAYSISE